MIGYSSSPGWVARWLMSSWWRPLERRQYAALWAFDSLLGRGYALVAAWSMFACGVFAASSRPRAYFVAWLVGAFHSAVLGIVVFRQARADAAKPIHPALLRRFRIMLMRLFFPPLPGAARERVLFLLAVVGLTTGMTIWVAAFFVA